MSRGLREFGLILLLAAVGTCANVCGLVSGLAGLADWQRDTNLASAGVVLNLIPVVAVAIWVALAAL
jgi:hypothetical protein